MGKKSKSKKNKSKQEKGGSGGNNEIDEEAKALNLTLELTDDIKASSSKSRKNHSHDSEPVFESTEQKAREDMEQCEKLLGVNDSSEESIEKIQERIELERERIREMLKDQKYEEVKKLSRKQQKNKKEVDAIFYNKRLRGPDKLRQLYDIVYKTINENQKLKEKQFEEQTKIEGVRADFESKLQGIQKQRKQKQMLYGLFQGLKDKNIEAYRLKDDAIRQQQEAKKEMTKMFETEIDKITNSYQDQLSIKSKYEAKKAELEVLAEEYKISEVQGKFQFNINSHYLFLC